MRRRYSLFDEIEKSRRRGRLDDFKTERLFPYKRQPEPSVFIIKLIVFSLICSAGIALTVAFESWGVRGLGIVIMGIMFAHAVELQHECLNNSAFKKPWMNRLVGFFLGLPNLVSYSHYQYYHLAHHRNLGTSKDAEFFDNPYLRIRRSRNFKNILFLLLSLFNIPRMGRVVCDIYKSILGNDIIDKAPHKVNKRLHIEYLSMLFILTLTIAICIATKSWSGVIIWLASLLLVGEPVHSLIELPEHVDCQRDSMNPHKNTRTIEGSWFSFWLTNGNNFHVEHHKHPSATISQLPLVYKTDPRVHKSFHRSYFDFYMNFFLGKDLTSQGAALKNQDHITEELCL